MRRVVPGEYSSAASSYSYSSAPYQSSARTTFSFSLTRQGRNLIILILAGLGIGYAASFFAISANGISLNLLYYLIQFNALVYQGWVVPLVTSIIVAPPNISGLEDVVFNAIALFFVDRLLSFAFSRRQYYLIFLGAGIFGNLLTLLNGPNYASFGASGGIFGLLAGAVTYDYALSKRINYSLLMWFLIWFLLSSVGPDVNWIAHVGGSLFGLVAGYYIGLKKVSPLGSRRGVVR